MVIIAGKRITSEDWSRLMKIFQPIRQQLIAGGEFNYVYTNGYVQDKNGEVWFWTEAS